MRRGATLIFCLTRLLLFLCYTVQASDIELIEEVPTYSDRRDYVVLELQSEDHMAPAPPLVDLRPVPLIPKDIWRHHIIPELGVVDALRLSYTSRFFNQILCTEAFINDKQAYFTNILYDLVKRPPSTVKLVEYAQDLRFVLTILNGYDYESQLQDYDAVLKRVRILWNLRYVPGVDLWGPPSGYQRMEEFIDAPHQDRWAARQTAGYFYHPNLRMIAGFVYTVGAVSSLFLDTPEAAPRVFIPEVPWIDLATPGYIWAQYFYDPEAIYGVNTLDLVCTKTYCFTADIMQHLGTRVVHRRVLEGLRSYTNGALYSVPETTAFIFIPWVLTVLIHQGFRFKQPCNQLDQATLQDAHIVYQKSVGLYPKKQGARRSWFVIKCVAACGMASLAIVNTKWAYDFFVRFTDFNKNYTAQVNQAVQSLSTQFVWMKSYTGADFFTQQVQGINVRECNTYFTKAEFTKLTPLFIQEGLMSSIDRSWQYVNGTLKYPCLWTYCRHTFWVLDRMNMLGVNTTVNAMFPHYVQAEVVNASLLPSLTTSGLWYASSIPQVLMLMQMMYLMFYAWW